MTWAACDIVTPVMARFFSQIATAVFLVLLVVGLLAGDAVAGHGNVGPVAAGFTWLRDGIDALLLVLFAAVGFYFSRKVGRRVTAMAALLLVALGVAGLFFLFANVHVTWDMRFPLGMDLFDLIFGLLGVLAALGTIEE